MAKEKRKSLKKQVQDVLQSKLCIGESKRAAKQAGTASEGIYSWNTYKAYLAQNILFTTYCKEQHGCRYLSECEQYIPEYLNSRSNLSAYTLKLDAAALRKLYGADAFIPETRARKRSEITRSRGAAKRDSHFNPEKNAELVASCRATGLRRSELEALRPEQLQRGERGYYFEIKGKGGRFREAPIIADTETLQAILRRCERAAKQGQKVWPNVPKAADIHSYRADYCHTIYDLYARDLEQIPRSERYYCRSDRAGAVFDKRAMLEASRALGHNRINVIAGHYLR